MLEWDSNFDAGLEFSDGNGNQHDYHNEDPAPHGPVKAAAEYLSFWEAL